jgi:hypothetical protein
MSVSEAISLDTYTKLLQAQRAFSRAEKPFAHMQELQALNSYAGGREQSHSTARII